MAEHEGEAIRDANGLFTYCRRRYGLAPEDVVGLLGVDTAAELGGADGFAAAAERLDGLLTLRSGLILWPEGGSADLKEALEREERLAWQALRQYRFMEFAHHAELWHVLAKLSGEKWRNPFNVVVQWARKQPGGRNR